MSTELTTLASRINAEHDKAKAAFETGFEHAVRCGPRPSHKKSRANEGATSRGFRHSLTTTKANNMAKIRPRRARVNKRRANFAKGIAEMERSNRFYGAGFVPVAKVTVSMNYRPEWDDFVDHTPEELRRLRKAAA
jgi:hypothetical protein